MLFTCLYNPLKNTQICGQRYLPVSLGNEWSLVGFGSHSEVWQYKVLILTWILSSIFYKGDTELVDNTLRFTGKSRWYNSRMPWITKAEPSLEGKLIRKIGLETNTVPVPRRKSFQSVFTIILFMRWLPSLSIKTPFLSRRC